ncbi:MAG: alpha/beta hydrolase [Parachlamydiaceae bacterium]|nr:alpha/beta hydrolase [Parachlamydiaceae bacterium]
MKVIFIPGNGGGGPLDNWFPYLKDKLEELNVTVTASEFPDAYLAREAYWIPFLKETLKVDEYTVLVGHSSGAIAAMRFAEKQKILGSVLVASYHTDLGMSSETESGYFDRPWDWDAIRQNQKWVIQFASLNDPWIPIEEARLVHQKLNSEYYESLHDGHFGGPTEKLTFPELFQALKAKLNS